MYCNGTSSSEEHVSKEKTADDRYIYFAGTGLGTTGVPLVVVAALCPFVSLQRSLARTSAVQHGIPSDIG